MDIKLQSLQDYLADLPPGLIADSRRVQGLLAEAWDSLANPLEGGMKAYKLSGRMEAVTWRPPILAFKIERHGGTVLGSTRAELQGWEVDIAAGVVNLARSRSYRRLTPMQPRLNVVPLVDAVAAAIQGGAGDPKLKWSADRKKVRVQIGQVIPDAGPAQTTANRRKNFSNALDQRLSEAGWVRVRPNNYSRP